MSDDATRIRELAEELTFQRDWLANGHRASDYGHDLLIALGNPDIEPASVAEFVSGEVDAGADPVSPNHGIGAENPQT